MNETTHYRESLDQLAEEFAERYRRGERPTVEEYAAAHPHLAAEIRDLFPTLAMIEELAPSDASEPEASARGTSIEVKPLDRIGDFRILREIGRGGMGVVYEAEQESLGRRVALKVLPLHSASDPKMLARFRRESRAAGQLHHTNIVPVFEVGEYGDICWYAMQFIPGQALDEVVKELQRLRAGKSTEPMRPSPLTESLIIGSPVRGPEVNTTDAYRPAAQETACPVADSTPQPQSIRSNDEVVELDFRLCCRNVARIGLQAADALAYAHARGVIHRDIKPSNLLLDTGGIVWVSDFGLAKTQDHALTETGDIVGTVRYMAPERFRGECDARSDVYSLGVTLYELLTLKPAFDNTDRLKLIESIGSSDPVKPRIIEPEVPRDVETIVLKAIDKDPRRRYPTANAMAADLRRYLTDEPIQARRVSVAERAWRWVRRNPVVTGLVAFAVIDLLVFFLVLINQNRRLVGERDAASAARDELRGTLYASQMNLVQSAYEADNVARALNILEKQRPQSRETDLRGWEWNYWRRQCLADAVESRRIPELPTDSGDMECMTISPGGRFVSAKRIESTLLQLRLWDSDSGNCRFERPGSWLGSPIAFSLGDQLLVTCEGRIKGSDGRIQLYGFDSKTGEERVTFERTQIVQRYKGLAVSGNGKVIATAASLGDKREVIFVWDAATGKQTASIPVTLQADKNLSDSRVVAVSPNGDRIVLSCAQYSYPDTLTAPNPFHHQFEILDVASGNRVLAFGEAQHHSSHCLAAAYSPDGRWLVTEDLTDLVIRDAATGVERRRWDVRLAPTERQAWWSPSILAISPDSRRLAFAGAQSTARVWDVETGRLVRTLKGHTRQIEAMTFSTDGTRIVTIARDQSTKSWILPSADSPSTPASMAFQAVSRDGRQFAVIDGLDRSSPSQAVLRIQDSPSGRIIQQINMKNTATYYDQQLKARVDQWTFTPDGQHLVFAEDNTMLQKTELRILCAATGESLRTISLGKLVRLKIDLTVSEDGRRLAASWLEVEEKYVGPVQQSKFTDHYVVWDFLTGREIVNLSIKGGNDRPWALSPDGSILAAVFWHVEKGGRVLRLCDVDSGRELRDIPVSSTVTALAFGATGRAILVMTGGHDGNTPSTGTAYDTATGEVLTHVRGVFGTATRIAFSPDCKRLAIASAIQETQSGEVKIWDLNSERELMTLKSPEMQPRSLHFTPDGHKLIFLGSRTGVTVWDGTPLPE